MNKLKDDKLEIWATILRIQFELEEFSQFKTMMREESKND